MAPIIIDKPDYHVRTILELPPIREQQPCTAAMFARELIDQAVAIVAVSLALATIAMWAIVIMERTP